MRLQQAPLGRLIARLDVQKKPLTFNRNFVVKLKNVFCALGRTDRLITSTESKPHSLGEADVGADGVFVPALSGVVPGRVALVARGVLCRKESTTIDV